MAAGPAPRYAMPNFRMARLVGIFNVIVGAEILLCGICLGGYVAIMPMWGRMFASIQQPARRQIESAKQAQLSALDEKAKAATTVEEKAEIAAERKLIETRQDPTITQLNMMDLNKMGLNDPTNIAWSWAEVVSGLVLNALLLASGIGLLAWRSWARRLGVWTAALKIVRLFVLWGFFIVAIVPPVSRNLGKMIGEMAVQQQASMGRTGGPVPTDMFVRVYTILYSGFGLGVIVLGSIYPVVVLWLLTRPGVKSACSGVFQKPKEPNQPC
jgi:hypothetical protein